MELATLSVLEVLETQNLMQNAQHMEIYFREKATIVKIYTLLKSYLSPMLDCNDLIYRTLRQLL